MAVGRRLNAYSGMRFDIPHLRSLESATSYDFDSLLRGLFTGLNQPYLIRGFKLVIPQATTEAQNLTIEVADSAVLHSSASESGTILLTAPGLPAEQLNAGSSSKVIGSFQPNAINYVSLDYRRVTDSSTVDQTAGWSPSQQLEFQRSVSTGKVLEYRFVITTNGFSTNLPLYMIKIDANNNFQWATKAVPSLFRLGSGGASPNPQNNFLWGNYSNNQSLGTINPRREWINNDSSLNTNPLTVTTLSNPNAFDFGDFSITNLKEWMDAVMTRFKELDGSDFWYVNSRFTGNSPNNFNTWFDSVGSLMTGAGQISYNLVLESSHPSFGKFQQQSEDSSIRTGDLYIEGLVSGTKANVVSYNNDQILINSMTASDFYHGTGVEGETLRMRRFYQPLLDTWSLDDYLFSTTRYGILSRKEAALSSAPFSPIASWSYETKGTDADFLYNLVTITTSSAHNLIPGDYVNVVGLETTSGSAPYGVHRVLDVSRTSPLGSINKLTFATGLYFSGTTIVGGSNGVRLDNPVKNPYAPFFKIHSYEAGIGTEVVITADDHNFLPEQQIAVSFTNGSKTVTLGLSSDVSKLKIGMIVTNAKIPDGATIVKINSNTFDISNTPTASSSGLENVDLYELISISGISAAGFQTDDLNGLFPVLDITAENDIVVDIGTVFSGTASVTNGYVGPVVFSSTVIVSDAIPVDYNASNVQSLVIGGGDLTYPVGPSTLPSLDPASGSILIDGVISVSKILNPVKVNSINYYLASGPNPKRVVVETAAPHSLEDGSGKNITIYGSQQLSSLIRSYRNVTVTSLTATSYKLTGGEIETDLPDSLASTPYTNPGTDAVYSKFDSNPYAGPVQWSSDILIKAIVGELSFKIPVDATIDETDPDNSIVANNFNIEGFGGTAYLQDGEVLYAKLKRNIIAGNGTLYSTSGGSAQIVTASIITDENGNSLEVGDWIKWENEDDRKWLKIKTISPAGFTLELNNGQTPNADQRPPWSGKIVYCKGSYPKLYVKKHIQVDMSSDVYYIAVRKDGENGQSKVYFRGLELQPGEIRQISDTVNSNLLTYIGAPNEGAVNPNYSTSGSGQWSEKKIGVQVGDVDSLTRMITVSSSTAPESGFQMNDLLLDPVTSIYYTVKQVLSSRTVIVDEDIAGLAVGSSLTYYRVNQFIQDQDNLTLAIRKEDRQAGHVDTALHRPVYDEMVYIQKINLSPVGLSMGTVKSGDYIYQGSANSPSALGWVLHGNTNSATYTVEDIAINAPGGNPTVTADNSAILVHIYYGTFQHNQPILQRGTTTNCKVNNPGNPTFNAPSVFGDINNGVEIVLPPNRRTEKQASGVWTVWGTHSYYKQSDEEALAGEELLVIVNDGIRHANIDYKETFGGPRAKIKLIRTLPPNTRMRFRAQASFGSAVAAKAADVSLQAAYNVGASILTAPARPLQINAPDVNAGDIGQTIRGSLAINGGSNQLGGIFNEISDQGFVIGKEEDKPKEIWTGMDAIKTHGSHPDSAWKRKTSAQTVTGDSATVITGSAIDLAEGQAYRIRMNAVARRSDGILGVSSLILEGTFYMTGGTVYAAGSPATTVAGYAGDGYNYAAAFGIQGNSVVLVVYGSDGATLQWAVGQDWQAVGVS